jgi:hypothetical protein
MRVEQATVESAHPSWIECPEHPLDVLASDANVVGALELLLTFVRADAAYIQGIGSLWATRGCFYSRAVT